MREETIVELIESGNDFLKKKPGSLSRLKKAIRRLIDEYEKEKGSTHGGNITRYRK